MAIVFTITDAGRAALVDPDNDGTNAVTIAEIGLGTGRYTPAKDQTDLRSPIKRVDTIAGKTVANDTLHVTVQDETADTYSVGEVGLFTDAGVLFAVYSQAEWIIEKAAPATLLLATDLVIESLDVSSITFGDAAFLNPPATETVQGVIELATQAEVDAGKDGRRAIVPRTLKAFIAKVLEAYATVKQLTDHAASRDHPGATTSAQGMVELATYGEAREGKDNSRALTPAADKAALDQHRTESGAHAGDRISLDSLKTLGNPKTVQAAFAALGSAALRNEGSGGGLDADKLDGQELEVFYRSNTSNPSIRMGSGSDNNWDGIVYDESANTFSFYADQTVGTDTPRAVLGAGYLDLAGRRLSNDGTGFDMAGPLVVNAGGHADAGKDYGIAIAAYEPSVMFQDDSNGAGNGLIKFNSKAFYFMIDEDASNTDDISSAVSELTVVQGYARFRGSLGLGNVTPNTSKAFNNDASLALGDDDSGIRGNGDGKIEIWANNKPMVTVTTAGLYMAQGAIEFPGGLYAEDGSTYALNLSNGDVIGANTIYWSDESNNQIEGIAFPRNNSATDASHWSTIRAYRDEMYFAPDASSGKSNKVFHEGNLPEKNRRDWGLWETNGSQDLLARGMRALVGRTGDLIINYASDFAGGTVVQSALSVTGAVTFEAALDMKNSDILNVNKITINDDGKGEGFMLPSFGFVQDSGRAMIVAGDVELASFYSSGSFRAYGNIYGEQDIQKGGKSVATEEWVNNKFPVDIIKNASGAYLRMTGNGNLDLHNGTDYIFRVTPEGRLDSAKGGIDAGLLDGSASLKDIVASGEIIAGGSRVRMGSGGSTNWDGIVYDEGANELRFYADQEVGKDTPRVTLGPGWIEAAGNRVWHEGDAKLSKGASGYQKLPSGLLIQWGTAPCSQTTNFPIRFNSVYAVTMAGNAASGDGAYAVYDLTTSSFTPDGEDIGGQQIFYIAIGT